MQEHDLSYVRTEMVLAQKPPRSASGFVALGAEEPVRDVPDTILTIFGLLLAVVIVVPLIRWASSTRSGRGTDRSFCATVAQGGIQPEAGPAPAGPSSSPSSSSSCSAAIPSTSAGASS